MSYISRLYSQTVYSVSNLSELKALTFRPSNVVMAGYSTDGDGGGGLWVWVADNADTADDGTVVACTSGPSGRYKRIYDGGKDVRWFGAVGDGTTDDRTALNAAFATGGHIILGGGKTYATSATLTIGVAGTVVDGLGTATLTDSAVQTSTLTQVTGSGVTFKGLHFAITKSSNLASFIRIRANKFTLLNVTFTGGFFSGSTLVQTTFNPSKPNLTGSPTAAVEYGNTGTPTAYSDFHAEGVRIVGGMSGILTEGLDRATIQRTEVYMTGSHGAVIGNTMPSTRHFVSDFRAIGCGQYGLTFANLTSNAAGFAIPSGRNVFERLYAENCGWATWLNGINGTLGGSGKYGFDFTSNGIDKIVVSGVAVNCEAGGFEFKHTDPSSPPTLYPDGFHNVEADVVSYTNLNGTEGLWVGPGSGTAHDTSDTSHMRFRGSATYEQAEAWVTGKPYNPYDVRLSGSYVWLCLGDATTGAPGTSGATSPSAAATALGITLVDFTTVSTNAATLAGSAVLSFAADPTNVAAGQTIFCGSNLADGTTVLSVDHGAFTVTANATATGEISSGQSCVFAVVVSDGALKWLCLYADPGTQATLSRGIEIRSSSNLTFNGWESINHKYGILLQSVDTSDLLINNVTFNGYVSRNSNYAVYYGSSSGSVTGLKFIGGDVEGTLTTAYFGIASGGTSEVTISGGRWRSGASANACIRLGAGTNTLHLDGGVVISAGAAAAFLSDSTGTHTVTCGAVTFKTDAASGVPVQINGAGTFTWGQASAIENGTPSTRVGWSTSSGAIAVRGRVMRTDLTTAPTTTTRANVGEYMVLATPTPIAWGWHVVAADIVTPSITWEMLPLGTATYGAPVTKTGDFTVGATENCLINNKSGSSCTVTLPAASSYSGRSILIINNQAQTVVSASSNVVPAAGGAAGTAILAGNAGDWAILNSNGTSWVIVAEG